MTYEQQVQQALDTLIDLCAFNEGRCNKCQAQQLCNSNKPKDLSLVKHNTSIND